MKHKVVGQVKTIGRAMRPAALSSPLTDAATGVLKSALHASGMDWDMFGRKCTSCDLISIVDTDGLCEYCNPASARKQKRLLKQKVISTDLYGLFDES
jgi:hypothetical protein